MATKKKAAKKKAAKKPAAKKKGAMVSLSFFPRLGGGGDPPPPWLRQVIINDAARAKQLEAWVKSIVQKIGRQG